MPWIAIPENNLVSFCYIPEGWKTKYWSSRQISQGCTESWRHLSDYTQERNWESHGKKTCVVI